MSGDWCWLLAETLAGAVHWDTCNDLSMWPGLPHSIAGGFQEQASQETGTHMELCCLCWPSLGSHKASFLPSSVDWGSHLGLFRFGGKGPLVLMGEKPSHVVRILCRRRYCWSHFWNIIFHTWISSLDLDIFLSSCIHPLSFLSGTFWVRQYPLHALWEI